MAIQLRVPQLDEGNLQGGGQVMQTTGLAPSVKGLYIPEVNAYAGVQTAAKSLNGLGDAFMRFAVEQEKIKQQAEAQHALNGMREQLSKAYTDYALLEGKNAIDGYDGYQKAVNQITQSTLDANHRTQFIERAVASRGEEIQSQYNQQGYAHQAKETIKWRDEENLAAIDQASTDACTHFNDPVLSAEAWDRWDKQVGIFLNNHGITPDSEKAESIKRQFRSNALSSLVDFSIDTKQYSTALKQLDSFKDKMDGKSYLSLYGRVKAHQIADAEAAARHNQVLKNQEISNTIQAMNLAYQNNDAEGVRLGKARIEQLVPKNSLLGIIQNRLGDYYTQNLELKAFKGMSLEEQSKLAPDLIAGVAQAMNDKSLDSTRGLIYIHDLNEALQKSQDKAAQQLSSEIKEIHTHMERAQKDGDLKTYDQLTGELVRLIGNSNIVTDQATLSHAQHGRVEMLISSFEKLPEAEQKAGAASVLQNLNKAKDTGAINEVAFSNHLSTITKALDKIAKNETKERKEYILANTQAIRQALKNKDFTTAQALTQDIVATIGKPKSNLEVAQMRDLGYQELVTKVDIFKNGTRDQQETSSADILSLINSAVEEKIIDAEQGRFLTSDVLKIIEQNDVKRGIDGMTPEQKTQTMNRIRREVAIEGFQKQFGINILDKKYANDPIVLSKFNSFVEQSQDAIRTDSVHALNRENEIVKAKAKTESMAMGLALEEAQKTPFNPNKSAEENINDHPTLAEKINRLPEKSQQEKVVQFYTNKNVVDAFITDPKYFGEINAMINSGAINDAHQLTDISVKYRISQQDQEKLQVSLAAKQGEQFSSQYKTAILNYRKWVTSQYDKEDLKDINILNAIDIEVAEFQNAVNQGIAKKLPLDLAIMNATATSKTHGNSDTAKDYIDMQSKQYKGTVEFLVEQLKQGGR